MALLMVSIYNRFCAIVKEEMQNSGLTLQPSAVMADFELVLIQAPYIESDNYTVIIHSTTDVMTIRHYGIRPCGKTPSE